MKRIVFSIVVVLSFACLPLSQAASGPLSHVFERVWETAKNEIYPGTLSSRFTPLIQAELSSRAAQVQTLEDLSQIINPFLYSLGISHTKFYQPRDPDYFFMRSLFTDRDPDQRPVWHIGIQLLERAEGLRVREVLEGYPAQAAGLRRGDLLLGCDGKPFHPLDCFSGGKKVFLSIERNKVSLELGITPVFESPARSFIQAMRNSVHIFQKEGRKIGYVHFWVGAFDENIQEYDRVIQEVLFHTDALILDLRGGFGGASLERVDHFFPDRTTYALMSGIRRDGSVTPSEAWEPHENPNPYSKPMVVLINEGTRSGKEMMAFQFKKTARATLVGSNTAGMFVGGRMWFSDQTEDYMLYLASVGALLDGVNLEGVGVKPDMEIHYPTDKTIMHDSQLEAALNAL